MSEAVLQERIAISRAWRRWPIKGTLFLDELGETSLRMQALLLRFVENGEIQRVGSDRIDGRVNVRIIAATNRNLTKRIAEGEFREDLSLPSERHPPRDSSPARTRRRRDDPPSPLSGGERDDASGGAAAVHAGGARKS